MAWAIKITFLAKEDIKDIKKWYRKKSIQALTNFTIELTNAIEGLRREDVEYNPVHESYRRLLPKDFPYTVYTSALKKIIPSKSVRVFTIIETQVPLLNVSRKFYSSLL